MKRYTEFSPAKVVLVAALLAVAGGIGFWGTKLSQPLAFVEPSAVGEIAAVDPAVPVLAAWFQPGDLRLDIEVKGLIHSTVREGAVVLAVNSQPPQAYMVGDELTRSVVLSAVGPDGIWINKAGQAVHFSVPQHPVDTHIAVTTGIQRAR